MAKQRAQRIWILRRRREPTVCRLPSHAHRSADRSPRQPSASSQHDRHEFAGFELVPKFGDLDQSI
jgi:hypothetical protein